jgi:hypothetical protein
MALTEEAARSRSAYPPAASQARRVRRAWLAVAWLAVLVATAVHVWVAADAFTAGFPTFSYDEIDTLMAGRAALGVDSPQISGAGYFPLSAILVSPVWWLTSDPFTFYRVAIAAGVVVALVTIWPLARISTRLGLSTPQAVTVAAVVMTLPARSVQADYAIAEKHLFLLLALAVLAAIRIGERPAPGRAVVFALLVALTYFTHARMLVFVVAAAAWLLLLLRRHRAVSLTGLVTLLASSWALDRLARHINGLVDPTGFDQGAHLLDNLSLGNGGMLLRTALGQAWEQLVSGFGLVAVGLVVAAALARRELRARAAGPACLVLLTTLGLYAGSALAWADPDLLYATTWRRLDAWIYGRYVDPAADLLVLIALSAVVRGVGRRTLAAAWCVALAVAVPTLLWLAPKAPTGAFITPAHIPGAMAWWWTLPTRTEVPGTVPGLTGDNRFWLIATLTALVPLTALTVLTLLPARRRPVAAGGTGALVIGLVMGLVMGLGAAGSVAADGASDRYQADHQVISPLARELRAILAAHPETTVGYDERCPKPVWQAGGRRNRFMWQLLPTVVSYATSGVDIAIVCRQAADRVPEGAVSLDRAAFGVMYAWVLPGPLQDSLREEGVLTTTH